MKRIVIFGVSLAISLASVGMNASAADEKDEKKKRGPEEVFKKLDADSDGYLTLAEFKGKREEEKARKAFDRKDKNDDDKLSLEEFVGKRKQKDEQKQQDE